MEHLSANEHWIRLKGALEKAAAGIGPLEDQPKKPWISESTWKLIRAAGGKEKWN